MKERINKATAITWIDRFYHRAEVMREIQSGKAEKNRKNDLRYTVFTVAVGAAITFIGFSGTDRISKSFDFLINFFVENQKAISSPNSSAGLFDLMFNLLVLGLFVASLLNLIYRWKEEHQALFQGVKRLSA